MSEQTSKRGIGCGVVVILAAIVLAVPVFRVGNAIWKVKRVEQTLNNTLGEARTYAPPLTGEVAPERMETFLRVRTRVFANCPEFQGYLDEVIRLEGLEENPDVSKSESMKQGFGGLKRLLQAGPGFLRFMEVRNQALLDESMGLGEYMYIYVLAYRGQLRLETDSRFANFEDAFVGSRARRDLASMIRNQLEAVEAARGASTDDAWVTMLREQVVLLETEAKPLPWETGLPPEIAASIDPYAATLDAVYCSGLAKMELSQKNKGFEIKN